MSRYRVLYLPIETKARELIGKTFLSARAVERGWIVVLGEGNHLRDWMQTRPAGTYIEIGVPEKKVNRLRKIHKAGSRVASLCEEGLVYWDGLDYCNRKLGPSVMPWIDRLLVVGERQANDVRTHRPAFADKVSVTGNPRFDVLLTQLRCVYQPEAARFRDRQGRFILFNSNFGRANPHPKEISDQVDKANARERMPTEERAEINHRFVEYKTRLMEGAQRFLQQLVSFPEVDRIVVRPHPVENHETWQKWAAPLNIEVRYEGSAIEWMLAAEAVIHAGCTTGIEGLLLDRPVFSYVPQPDAEFLNPADLVSEWVRTPEELVHRLVEVRSADQTQRRPEQELQQEKLVRYVANVTPPFSADRILDELESFDPPTVRSHEIVPWNGWFHKLWRNSKEDLERPVSTRKLQKFPPTRAAEMEQCIDQWIGTGVLKQAPAIKTLGERLWVFYER